MDSMSEDLMASSAFDVDVSGPSAVGLKDAIQAKLAEFMGSYTDDVLAEYVVVLVGHGKQQAEAIADLEAFLGEDSRTFVTWLWNHLEANKSKVVTPSVPIPEVKVGHKRKSPTAAELGHTTEDLSDTSPRVQAPRRLLQSAVRDAIGPVGKSGSMRSASTKREPQVLESNVGEALGSSAVLPSKATYPKMKDSRLLDSAVQDAVTSTAMTSAGGNSSRRTNSRSFDPAVRDVTQASLVGSTGNLSQRTQSSDKRFSSVLAEVDKAGLVSGTHDRHQHAKSGLFKQGPSVPPAVAVALKAAAAAAEDVNKSAKIRSKSSGSVWDRLGSRSNERVTLKENEIQDFGRRDAYGEVVYDARDDVRSGEELRTRKRPKLRTISQTVGSSRRNVQLEDKVHSELGSRSYGYHRDRLLIENDGHQVVESLKDDGDVHIGVEHIREARTKENGRIITFSTSKDTHAFGVSLDATSSQYRHGGIERNVLQRISVAGSAPAGNSVNKLSSNQINVYGPSQMLSDAGAAKSTSQDFPSHLLKDGASIGKPDGSSSAVLDTQDVLEMKKRMQQVQLEMIELRAKQAEVSEEAQKAGSVPSSDPKIRSHEDVDLHSVCVTNIHFAATKEVVAAHFNSCGDIVRVTMLIDFVTGKPKGSAFVEFTSKDSVEKALELSGSSLLSRVLKVGRKDALADSVATQTLRDRPSLGSSFISKRASTVRKFLRRSPLILGMHRPFPGAANLQWKRDLSSPILTNGNPKFAAVLQSPTASMMRYTGRYRLGPIQGTRSMSYVRPTPYPRREIPAAVQEQKVVQ